MKSPAFNYIFVQSGTNEPLLHFTEDLSPVGFAAFLYDAADKYFKDGDKVWLCGVAVFDQEKQWRIPSIEMVGIDVGDVTRAKSQLYTSCMIDPHGAKTVSGPSIVLSQRNIFRNLALVGRCWKQSEDAAITGHDEGGGQYVEFDACTLDAKINQDWGVYYQWSGNVNNGTTIVRNCDGYFSRWLVSECGSASPKAQLIVEDSQFYGNADGSYTDGATNKFKEESACCPFLFRSGTARFKKVECAVLGPTEPPKHPSFGVNRVVGLITNVYSSAGGPVSLECQDVIVKRIEKGYANEVYKYDLRYGSPAPKWDNSGLIAKAESDKAKAIEQNKAEFDVFVKASRARVDAAEAAVKAAAVPAAR